MASIIRRIISELIGLPVTGETVARRRAMVRLRPQLAKSRHRHMVRNQIWSKTGFMGFVPYPRRIGIHERLSRSGGTTQIVTGPALRRGPSPTAPARRRDRAVVACSSRRTYCVGVADSIVLSWSSYSPGQGRTSTAPARGTGSGRWRWDQCEFLGDRPRRSTR